jgi:MacB-like periplasmic core domain
MGLIEQSKEEYRDMHMNIIDNLMRDIRYALRTLTRNPGFTLAGLGALVLGIGANTAVFSVLNGVLLRPLPYADPDRLVMIFDSFQQQGLERGPAGIADFLDWKARAGSFHTLDAIANQRFTLVGDGEAEQIAGRSVTATFFETLGVRPLVGRTFASGDDQPGRAQSVVISERLWRAPLWFERCHRGQGNRDEWPSLYHYRRYAGRISLCWRCGSVVDPHP